MSFISLRRAALVSLATVTLAACGGDDSTDPSTVTMLSVTLNLVQGETCDTGGQPTEFTGLTGQTVTITATTSSSLAPQIALYEPDFTTLLGTSVSGGAGKATLIKELSEAGTFHISVCETTGKAGQVKVVVTRPIAG